MNDLDSTKKCNRCEDLKPLDEFYKNSASHDGRRSICKICHDEARKRTGTDGTESEASMKNYNFQREGTPLDPSLVHQGGAGTVLGTELVLAMHGEGGMLEMVAMCPACCHYNVLWERVLQAPEEHIPIGVCNDCLLQVDADLVRFYVLDDTVFMVRSALIHAP